jgi:hypothetical protein
MRKNINNFIIIAVATLSISIIFSLATITTIEPTYANHTIYHLNNSLVDVTISSDGDIPDAVLDELLPVISNYVSQKRESNADSLHSLVTCDLIAYTNSEYELYSS